MMASTPNPRVPGPDTHAKGNSTVHLKLMGCHDAASQQLRESVEEALAAFPMAHTMIEVCEPNAIAAAGITATPALLIDGQLVAQGRVPAPAEIIGMLRDRHLHRSKLYRLRSIGVAIDIGRSSESALCFAWHLARKVGASIEVVYAMDSIFVGDKSSVSGFLSDYQHTMQLELDVFIRATLARIGVAYEPPAPGGPGQPPSETGSGISTKLIYGSPHAALEAYSRHVDLLVLGTTGQGASGKRRFGSVSTEVSQRAHCPVLLVPPDAEFRGLQHMLYASHFDSLSTLRIRQALSFAQHFDGQVHFVHVGPGGEEGAALEQKLFEAGCRESPSEQPLLFAKIAGEDVLGALYDYALYHRIELLVLVTHQRSFWESILHRSLIRAATGSTDYLPTLIIHSDEDMVFI